MTIRSTRLTVLVTHPIQYQAPLYHRLAARGVVDLEVIYLSDAGAIAQADPGFAHPVRWDLPLLEGYRYQILQPGSPVGARSFWNRYDPGLKNALALTRPDWLLVYGYYSRMNWVATRWAKAHNIKVAYSSDSNAARPERWTAIKKRVLKHYFRRVDAFLAPSERNVDYLLKYRADPNRIRRIPLAIDVARFARGTRESTRRYDFIWVGKFLGFKRAGDFVDALAILARRSAHPIRACLVGDGPVRGTVQAAARQLPNHCSVDFPGFVNQSAMPALLQSAATLVFTSERDAYGLAATEAAAAGLALVVTDNLGCVGLTVLAQPGRNAFTFKVGDIEGLADAMERLLLDPDLCQRMQNASMEIVSHHDVDDAARVLEHVVAQAANSPGGITP